MWRRIRADGCEWEVRVVAREAWAGESRGEDEDLLEFRSSDGLRPPRRIAVPAGALARMGERELRSAYRRALPIAGDHYGRPGKRMHDAGP